MIHFSFSTVYMTVITCTIMIALLAIYFRVAKLMVNAGYRLLIFVAILCLFRLWVPVEFPFTTNVYFSSGVSRIVSQIRHPLFSIRRFNVSIWSIIAGIWLISFVVIALIYLRSELALSYAIRKSGVDITHNYHNLDAINHACAKNKKAKTFHVVMVDGITSPMVYGISSPVILIPKGVVLMNFPPEEFEYILYHEISHFYQHDLITKRVLSILCLIYWWNPFCRILSKRFDIAMEMRVDNMITNSDASAIATYTKCLIKLYQYAVDSDPAPRKKIPTAMPLIENEEQLIKRFEMMKASTEKPPKTAKLWRICLITAIIVTFISSYLFILEPSYMPPEIAASTIRITDANGYAVKTADGDYDIYYDGYFLETTDNLDYYESDMPIYTEDEAPVPRMEIETVAGQEPGK